MRDKYPERRILLRNFANSELAAAAIMAAPLDHEHPLEAIIREQVKARTPDQNSLMWAGPLRDMEEQAYLNGKTYSAETWHEHFKRAYLPEADDPELALLVKDADKYVKWAHLPNGDRACIGSTTSLSRKGMGEYLDKVYAFGGSLGVQFHEVRHANAA